MGIGPSDGGRLRQPDVGEQGDRGSVGLLTPGDGLVDEHDLGHLATHAHRRVEGGHRLLEDHGDQPAADVGQIVLAGADEVDVRPAQPAPNRSAQRLRQEAEDGQCGEGLARAGLADQADPLPAPICSETFSTRG